MDMCCFLKKNQTSILWSELVHLDVIIEDQMVIPVPVQQWVGIGHVEILKLKHSIRPSPHHGSHKLINHLHASRHEAWRGRMKVTTLWPP